MRPFALVLCCALTLGAVFQLPPDSRAASARTAEPFFTPPPAPVRYRLDAGRSSFMARAFAGGPLWFKGHDHFVRVQDFAGEVQLDPSAPASASLRVTARADSLAETRDVFTEPQKQIINKELREIVFETAKYPEIIFQSTEVKIKGTPAQGVPFDVQVGGDLTLHGVTRHVRIPAQVTLRGDDLRARGEFTVGRGDFNVKATSAFHGLVRVRDKVKLTFDLTARRL